MHNIYFLPAWGNSSSELLEVMRLQTPSETGTWKDIKGTNSLFEADTFIVQDYTYDEVEDFLRINNEKFIECPNESVDYAVMEKIADQMTLIPASFACCATDAALSMSSYDEFVQEPINAA